MLRDGEKKRSFEAEVKRELKVFTHPFTAAPLYGLHRPAAVMCYLERNTQKETFSLKKTP